MRDRLAGLQERVEGTTWGRALISAFVAFTLLAILVGVLPDSELRRKEGRIADRYLLATGLEQDWGMFAPEPRRESLGLRAVVTMADGSKRNWSMRQSNDLFGEYSDYRWMKWMEFVTLPDRAPLWPGFANWIARHVSGPGEHPVRIDLYRRFRVNNPPGPGPAHQPWREEHYYRLTDAKAAAEGLVR